MKRLGVALVVGFGNLAIANPQPSLPSPIAEPFNISQAASLSQATSVSQDPSEPLNAPYVPTPQVVVDRMLELAGVGPDDVVYDLGSGDGRVVITAAKQYGARGIGIEIDPALVAQARANAEAAGVADRVEFRQQDLFDTDLSDATVVTLYLLQEVNLRLRHQLLALKPGTRIVSHSFDMGDWQPEQTAVVEADRLRILYKWTVPAEIPEHLRSSP